MQNKPKIYKWYIYNIPKIVFCPVPLKGINVIIWINKWYNLDKTINKHPKFDKIIDKTALMYYKLIRTIIHHVCKIGILIVYQKEYTTK